MFSTYKLLLIRIIRPAMCLVKVLYGAQLVKTKVMYNCSVMKKCKRWFHNGLVFFVTFEQSPILIFRRRRRVIRLSAYYMTWLGVVPWNATASFADYLRCSIASFLLSVVNLMSRLLM